MKVKWWIENFCSSCTFQPLSMSAKPLELSCWLNKGFPAFKNRTKSWWFNEKKTFFPRKKNSQPEWKSRKWKVMMSWSGGIWHWDLSWRNFHLILLFLIPSTTSEKWRVRKRFNFCFDWNWTKIKWNHLKLVFKEQRENGRTEKKNHRENFLQLQKEHIFIVLFYILKINWRFSHKIAALYSTYFVYHFIHHDKLHTYERVKKGFSIEKWYECLMWSFFVFSFSFASHEHVTMEHF